MVSLERKFDVLHHSIATFTRWLDSCSTLLKKLSAIQTNLELGQDGVMDESKLRDLALQYKDMLLKIKEQCSTLQEINALCKELKNEAKTDHQVQRQTKACETITSLSQQFSTTCGMAKLQYAQLSSLLQATSKARNSPPGGLKFLPRSLSQTPTLGHRVSKTPPPSTPPRPSSAQTHRRVLSGSHYQPVFVRPTTFSLEDREKEETGAQKGLNSKYGVAEAGLNSKPHGVSDGHTEDDIKFARLPKAPVSSRQNHTKYMQTGPQPKTKAVETGPKETKPKTKAIQTGSKETKPKTKAVETGPKETKPKTKAVETTQKQAKTRDMKSAKKSDKKRKSDVMSDESDVIPEILSLEGSPVIAGRRIFKMPSQESLDDIGRSVSPPSAGQSPGKRGSPDLPVFGKGLPNPQMEQPKSPGLDHLSDGRVRVLPALKPTPNERKSKTPPPIVKPKPTVPRKPQALREKTAAVEEKERDVKQLEKRQPLSEREEEKVKEKKASRFSKLYSFASGTSGGGGGGLKKMKKDTPTSEKRVKEEEMMQLGGVAGAKDVAMGDWDIPDDGRESPILQGRGGVKVMLKDDNMEIPVLSPRKVADSTKKRTLPPPVAKKPVGLMERITTDKKTKTHPKSSTPATTITDLPGVSKTTPPPQTPPTTTTPTHPSPESGEATGKAAVANPTSAEETVATSSQLTRPQQLRVQTFKLDNLARESVSSSGSVVQQRPGRDRSAVKHQRDGLGGGTGVGARGKAGERSSAVERERERDRSAVKHQRDGLGGGTGVSARGKAGERSSVVGLRERERGTGGLHTMSGTKGEVRNVRERSKERFVDGGHTRGLEPESDRDRSHANDNMELGSRYDRLGHGNGRSQNGSVKYDHLASRDSEEDDPLELSVTSDDISGHGFNKMGVATEDKGQSYYIGGRGRRESDLDAPSPPSSAHLLREDSAESGSLRERLNQLSAQLQTHIQAIAERERCSLRSLELEMHSGEIKAMLTLLEVHELELMRLRAQISPSSKRKFGSLTNPPAPAWPKFPLEEVQGSRDEVVKLSERIQLLERHCRDSITQVEEVMEFVVLFERDLKELTDILSEVRDKLQLSLDMGRDDAEGAWNMLTEALTGVNAQRTKLSSIEQLSNHLLYLEPIFDGDCVRGDMQHLSTEYQGIILEIFSQLEALARVKSQSLLVEISVIGSWATESELALQALVKRSKQSSGAGDRIAASKESLENSLREHKLTLLSVTRELDRITSLLSPADHDSLRELVLQVSQVSKSLVQIEDGLATVEFAGSAARRQRVKGNGARSKDSDYAELSELEDSVKMLERKQSRVVPPVPVRNVNGAKANVKDSDYAHIGDVNVHGHTPKMKRKSLLKPYAQVSMKDSPDEVAMETTSDPPPLPTRPSARDEDSKRGRGPVAMEIKPGQSIRDLPLPPRPDEIEEDDGSLTPSPTLPSPQAPTPPPSHATYDSLPKADKRSNRDSLYDVPRSILRDGEPYDTYDTPRSALQRPNPGEGTLPRQPEEPQDLYDVPRSVLGDHHDIYDVPRTLTRGHDGVMDVPRKTGQTSTEQVSTTNPDDSVFSLPLYDVPRSLLTGRSKQREQSGQENLGSGHTSSGQGSSGHTSSGQGSSGREEDERDKEYPEMMYDVPKSLLEPPSPLVEFNQVTTRHLDRAIHRLPHSAPYRPDLDGMGVELRVKGAGLRPSSLHEDLLQHFMDEWSQIPKESSPPPAEDSRLVIEETARLLDDHTHMQACLAFSSEVGGLEENIRGAAEKISNLRVPQEPDLERVHGGIDHCESMLSQLKKLQSSLSSCNEKSMVLLASLSTPTPPPTLPPPSPTPPSTRLTQLMEIWLFDLTTMLQTANLQLVAKLRELRERETLTNTLHRHIQTLTHTLSVADKLVKERDDVIEVRGHLQQCKDMHDQLSSQSNWIDQLVDEMKNYVSANPQSQACQSLLDQVKQVKEDWAKVCGELAVVPQLEPTLRVNMLKNVAMAIKSMETDLPRLEVTTLNLDDVIAKQRKARSLVSKCRQYISSLQATEVNLLQTMSPPAGNHGNHVSLETVGRVDVTQQRKKCQDLQQDCKRIMSELKTLSSLLATGHTLLERLEKETQDLRVWLSDTRCLLQSGEMAVGTQQHRVRFQAISQQLLAKQSHMESYQSLISEVLLLPVDDKEKKRVEKDAMALFTDWDTICHQCVPAGTLPLMSPTTPQNKFFRAPQEFEDPLQMVEWLIMLDFKLQPERLVVGDFLHVRRALQDLLLIEAELKSKEAVYNFFMKDVESHTDAGTEHRHEQSDSHSPTPLSESLEDSLEFNPSQGVNAVEDKSLDRRRRRFENLSGMESVQEQSSEDDRNGTATPHIPETDNDSTPRHDITVVTTTPNRTQRRQLSMDSCSSSSSARPTDRIPKQPSLPLLLSHSSLPHGTTSTPPSSLPSMQATPTQHSLLSSLSSVDYGSRSLFSRQGSMTGSITASLAELLAGGSPGTSIPEDLYQLQLLWNGIKMAIEQKRQRLEQIQDLWKSFEEKKEVFTGFLTRVERRLREFPLSLAQAMDLAVIQSQIETQKSLLEEIPEYERKLAVLKDLGQELATGFHADDSTADLQDVLQDMNKRWTVVMENVARHQPEVNLLSQQWAEFHSHYQSFSQWLRNMDTDMANLNPFVSNMATVQLQLVKLKEIQEELKGHEGVLDALKLFSYKLHQEEGSSCHVNPAAIRSRLENASRRWDHLKRLAQERHSALEESLTDKQQLLTRMADCLSWLQQAEKHMASQKPLGGDYYQIHTQYLAHQSFSQEVSEQTPKMEAVIQAGRSGLLDVQWPLGTPERSRMDSLRVEFSALERRWGSVKADSEQWGKILESLHPEMETFQTLCAECGQRLSEVELRASGMPPLGNRVVMLTQQLEELREFEAGLVVVGNVLGRVIGTQKKLVQLGAKVSTDLSELVRRFHERWVEVKKKVTNRYSAIDKAMVKYDPENLGVATLPRGWIREKSRNGTPYYVENRVGGVQQWKHPELSRLYRSMDSEFDQPCYPNLTYPAALKLRTLQKKTQLHLMETRVAMQTFEEDHIYNIYNSHKMITSQDMIMLCLGLFEQAEQRLPAKSEPLYINRAVELSAAWIRDVFDITHEGAVACISFQVAMLCLSQSRLDEKHRCLFKLVARSDESISHHQLAELLENVVQIPQNVLQTQYCSVDSLDFHIQDCFKKFSDEEGQLSLSQFLSWVQTEPLPLSWLAVMHRAAASEATHHDVRCAVCRTGPPITGFRYRCQQCHNYDMCQSCFWSGGTTHGHDRTRHYMEEYCVVRPSGDELKDFFRNLQRHVMKKKKKPSASDVLQEHAPQIIGDHSPARASGAGRAEGVKQSLPAAKQRHVTAAQIRHGGSPSHRAHGEVRERGDGTTSAHDIDFSLVKISEDDRTLSQTLDTLRRHHDSLTSDLASQATPQRSNPLIATGNKPHPPTTNSLALESRVQVLEDHNSRLEGCISQLKMIAANPPQLPSSSSNKGPPPHSQASNGSPAHLTPRGSPYIRPERKYHYVTMTTPNPAHKSNTPHYSTTATNQQVATRSPSHSNYVPISPAHQRLQPPALVRNKYRNQATTTLL